MVEDRAWQPAMDRAQDDSEPDGLSGVLRDFLEYYGAGGKWPLR